MMCRNTDICKDRTRCIGELCFGKFLHTMIAGWDDSECQRTFDCLCTHTCMLKHIKIVVSSKPGKAVMAGTCKIIFSAKTCQILSTRSFLVTDFLTGRQCRLFFIFFLEVWFVYADRRHSDKLRLIL